MNYSSASVRPGHVTASPSGSRDEVVDLEALDWNRVWQAQLDKGRSQKRDAGFWDTRAPSFSKAALETDYVEQLLEIMGPKPHWTAFDMGCGSGAVAIPLARHISSVTAVDFSGGMLSALRKRCEAEKVHNVTTIHGGWEDDWDTLGITTYDVAIASRSMVVDDLEASIQKLNAVARKRVFIVTVTGDGPRDRRLFEAIGRPVTSPGPDYIYYYNMLYHMGLRANVSFIQEKRNRTYESPEDAAASMQWMFEDLSAREQEKLARYLKEHLVFDSGSWRLSYANVIRWAVMWWEKE